MNVAIVAIGARTPVGARAASTAAAVRCELRRVREHSFLVDAKDEPIPMGTDESLDPTRLGAVRLLVLARSALREVLSAISADVTQGPRIDVLLSLPEARPGFTDANARWVARELPQGLLPGSIDFAASGHAGSLDALRDGARRIEAGHSNVYIVVGADSYLAPDTIEWLDASRRIAGKGKRDGFFPGEAAGCVALASPELARMSRWPILAYVRGAHSARERTLIRSEEEVLGNGLAQAILGATASLRLPAEAIDDIYCDLDGERYRTDEWGFALLRAGNALRTVSYHQPATSWGNVGAAAGTLGCVLAIRAWARKYANGPRALVWGSSEGGLRSAVVLEDGAS